MTSLIKNGSPSVRAVEWRFEPQSLVSDHLDPLPDPYVSALEAKLAAREEDLERLSSDAAIAVEQARREGRAEAEAAYKRDETEVLARIEGGAQIAVQSLKQRLDELDGLAALMCETALAQALGAPAHYGDMIAKSINAQTAALRREIVLAIRVSSQDVSDGDALRALAQKINLDGVAITRDAELASGECKIEVRLGQIELSLPRYWAELRAPLRQFSAGQT